ncbi:MAG: hypothetical protein KA998_01360 [Rickettsiaceae bacterium]|nr:hypothetical protein [Rickettsiaceae bacterium]
MTMPDEEYYEIQNRRVPIKKNNPQELYNYISEEDFDRFYNILNAVIEGGDSYEYMKLTSKWSIVEKPIFDSLNPEFFIKAGDIPPPINGFIAVSVVGGDKIAYIDEQEATVLGLDPLF